MVRTDEEWQASLDPEAYRVLRKAGTERPGSSPYAHPTAGSDGVYRCAGCGAELFRAEDQFDSGTGWPSFTDRAAREAVTVRHDFKLVDAKPQETASDVYRFEMKLPAGASKALTVTEERCPARNSSTPAITPIGTKSSISSTEASSLESHSSTGSGTNTRMSRTAISGPTTRSIAADPLR